MNFNDALAETSTDRYTCKIADLLDKLDNESREQAIRALNATDGNQYVWSASKIVKAFSRFDLNVCATTVNKHRAGACRCG